jgi:hypothetical protein
MFTEHSRYPAEANQTKLIHLLRLGNLAIGSRHQASGQANALVFVVRASARWATG